ncbi:DUF4401 domain-containing protein [Halopseudomonas sp. SMJS2]|uniref:DUF4401 domain-containing protein n=1 Tax=Halopseudomonas sp. SMJS2 TaxID=3041098 RepID=UPI00245285BC|nr:DUF4401 domain-containing protein [Halopseudomonas sp. SMJS2]WGK60449.1 DUF4401 domain-containing protein [Halopseudomonas sp. SMJS2]
MNRSWQQALLDELQQRRILEQDEGMRLQAGQAAPWYMTALSGFAAWFAALMLLAAWVMSLGSGPLPNLFAGVLLLLTAIGLLRGSGAFVPQLGLAFSMLGQALLVFFSAELQQTDFLRLPALVALLVAIGMLLVPAGSGHRFVCALAAMLGLVLLFDSYFLLSIQAVVLAALAVWLWLRRAHWAHLPQAGMIRAVAGAATLVAVASGIIGQPSMGGLRWILALEGDNAGWLAWLYPLGATLVLLATLVWLTSALQWPVRLGALAGALVLAALSSPAPGLLIAAALWLAVFHACDRLWSVLVGVGVAFYLSDLYYSLHITLLVKSILLVASGLLLLALRQWLVMPLRRAE